MASLYSNRGAKRAREARADLDFTREGPLPDLLQVLEERASVHAVVLDLPEGLAGAYAARPDCPLLFVNGRQALSRQRFTLAHEFGHHRMSHSSVVDEQRAISGYDHDPTEVAANAFAAEFLMPRDAIRVWGYPHARRGAVTLEHVVVLATEYGVSAQAARYALETAGVLTDRRRCEHLDREIADDLHIELSERLGLQPLQDELADAAARLPRIPRTLRDTAFGDLLAGGIDADELAIRLHRSTDEVDAMLSELRLDQLLPARS